MGYICSNEHEESVEATTHLTNLETGDVVTLCAPCFAGWMCMVLEELGFTVQLPGAAENGAVAPGEGETAPDPVRPKRGRRGGGEPPGDGVGDQVPDAASYPVEVPWVPPELTAPSSPFTNPAPDNG